MIMKEEDYIHAKSKGTIDAAIEVLKTLVPKSLPEIIHDGEFKNVLGTLYDWQDRLFEYLKSENLDS